MRFVSRLRGHRCAVVADAARHAVESLECRRLFATAYALAGSNLLTFDTATPGTIAASVPVTGLQSGESLLGIDSRPTTGELFGLGSADRLYTINPATGTATLRDPLSATLGPA